MAQAPSLWGDALNGFTGAISNPLTLGGLSLLSGGDLNSGIQAGTALQKQQQQQRQMQAFQQGIQGMPNLSDNDRSLLSNSPDLANEVLSTIYKNRFDPNAGLEAQYKRAQINKLNMEASGGGETPSNIREWNAFQKMSPQQQQQYLTMKRANPYLNLGDQYGLPNAANPSGPLVNTIPINNEKKAFDKKAGELNAEGQNNLPKSQIALSQSEIQNKTVNDSIDQAIKNADGYTSGFMGSVTSNIPGTKAYDLSATLGTVKANLGFDKLQDMRNNSPTGGALGAISDQENKLLQSVWGNIEQAQSPAQLKANLGRIKQIRQQFQQLRQRAYDMDVTRYGKQNVPDWQTGQLPSAQQPNTAPAGGGWSIKRVD